MNRALADRLSESTQNIATVGLPLVGSFNDSAPCIKVIWSSDGICINDVDGAVMSRRYVLTVSIQSTIFVMKCWYYGNYTDCSVPARPSGKGPVNIRQWERCGVRGNVILKGVRVTTVAVGKQYVLNILSVCL